VCQALSVIDNTVLLAAFTLDCIPSFVKYLYPEMYRSDDESQQHPVKVFYLITEVFIWPVAMLAQAASIWVTVLMGVNRYIVVCKPFQVNNALCRSVFVDDFN
jgi:hypothetical protein